MGAVESLPAQPQGTVTIVIEDERRNRCSSCSPRYWDASLQKPPFVDMELNRWAEFTIDAGAVVRRYHREGLYMMVLMTLVPLGAFVSFVGGVRGTRRLQGLTAAVSLLVCMFMLAVIAWAKSQNERRDEELKYLCKQYKGSGATFTLETRNTQLCKRKHQRQYRALHIIPTSGIWAPAQHIYPGAVPTESSPLNAAVPVALPVAPPIAVPVAVPATSEWRVTVPEGAGENQVIVVQTASGPLQAMVPPGCKAGDVFTLVLPTTQATPV